MNTYNNTIDTCICFHFKERNVKKKLELEEKKMFAVIQIQYLAITQKPVINSYTIISSGFEFIPENP